jgi:hypothetical protein|tara:strand:- start:707 stop:1111 length:405 start_codon:yes stop_codon:yes gene_type:complete
MNKLQEMRQQLERDEKRRDRKEMWKMLLKLFLWLIAIFGGMVLAVWIADQFSNRHSSEGVVFSFIGLCTVAYLVDCMIKGIKTGELRATTDGGSAVITKRKNEPKKFWFFVYINLVSVLGILLGIFYWIFIGAG